MATAMIYFFGAGGASSLKKAEPPGRSLPEWPSSAPVSLPKEMPAAKGVCVCVYTLL